MTMATRPEPTVANADLWSKYFRDQWSRWLNPLGLEGPVAEFADGTGARVANFLSLVAAGPIAFLYETKGADVVEIAGDDERASLRPYRAEREAEAIIEGGLEEPAA
jgi:hypothetical protein